MKKKIILPITMTLLLLSFFFSCTKKSADQLPTINPTTGNGGTTSCDTVNMKYATDVLPILQAHCYSCHGSNTAGSGGISLDSYSNLKTYASGGFLVGNITHAPGYIGMPYGQPKMDDCTINKIIDWVQRGALNN